MNWHSSQESKTTNGPVATGSFQGRPGPFRALEWGLLLGCVVCLFSLDSFAMGGDPPYVPNQVAVELLPGRDIDDVNSRWGTTTLDSFDDGIIHLVDATGLGDVPTLALQMTNDPDVLEAEPNFIEDNPEGIRQQVLVFIGGDITDYEDQGMATRLGLAEAHAQTRGLGVIVAVLDSGIDPAHEVFQGRLLPGYDFVDEDNEPWEEANGLDDDGDGLIDDGFGHGTMVAGLVRLVAPDAYILPIRVLNDEGRSDDYTVARAVRFAREAGAHVINMSFGSPEGASLLQNEFERAQDEEIIMVSGAGNESREEPAYYPGESSKVIMVAALDSVDVKADFSDWNDEVLVSAPGDGVRSAYPGGGYAQGAGCSFATPLVSGEAALIRALRPTWREDRIEDHIEDRVDPIYHLPGNQPYDEQLGTGRINVGEAVLALVTTSVDGLPFDSRWTASPSPTTGAVRFQAGADVSTTDGWTLQILDARGRRVRSITGTGPEADWDGRDADGRPVPGGVYFFQSRTLETESPTPGRLVIIR